MSELVDPLRQTVQFLGDTPAQVAPDRRHGAQSGRRGGVGAAVRRRAVLTELPPAAAGARVRPRFPHEGQEEVFEHLGEVRLQVGLHEEREAFVVDRLQNTTHTSQLRHATKRADQRNGSL